MTLRWAFLCEHAFFDRLWRLCVSGAMFRLTPERELPFALSTLSLVVAYADPVDENAAIALAVTTPSGRSQAVPPAHALIESTNEFVVAHMRDIQISETGVYLFSLRVGGAALIVLELPIVPETPTTAAVH